MTDATVLLPGKLSAAADPDLNPNEMVFFLGDRISKLVFSDVDITQWSSPASAINIQSNAL